MKKILFIGKFNVLFKDINNYFDKMFNVQACGDDAEMVKGMLKLKKPDIVVISLIDVSDDAGKIIQNLKYNYPSLPVLCIGRVNDIEAYSKEMDTSQFFILFMPTDNDKILEAICNRLNISYEGDKIVEKSDRKCVLVVDDNGLQLRALNDMLKSKYEVKLATSGMQALTTIGKKKPDVIILDYEMPVCDGRMTLEMIRELDEAKDIPVIFLTGVNDKEHIAAVLALKPAGYLLKPANATVIYETLERVLENSGRS